MITLSSAEYASQTPALAAISTFSSSIKHIAAHNAPTSDASHAIIRITPFAWNVGTLQITLSMESAFRLSKCLLPITIAEIYLLTSEKNVTMETIEIMMDAVPPVSARTTTFVPISVIIWGTTKQITVPICMKSISKSSQ